MKRLVIEKLRGLGETIADLKARIRLALAGELAQAVASAVQEVVAAVVAGRRVELSPKIQESYRRPSSHSWDDDPSDRWVEDPWEDDSETYYQPMPQRPEVKDDEPSGRPEIASNVTTAVAAGVHAARWWLKMQHGTMLVAGGVGLAVGLLGLLGGTAVRATVATLAAVADLLNVTSGLESSAARLNGI